MGPPKAGGCGGRDYGGGGERGEQNLQQQVFDVKVNRTWFTDFFFHRTDEGKMKISGYKMISYFRISEPCQLIL